MIRSKFFWKNFLSFMLIIGFTAFVVSYLLVIQAQQFVEDSVRESLEEKLSLLTLTFEDGSSWREPETIRRLTEIAKDTHTRISVLDENEGLLMETNVDEVQPADHKALRPELLQAKQEEIGTDKRLSATSQLEMLYVAKKIETPEGGLLIRVGVPMLQLQERLSDIFLAVAVGAGFGVLLSLLLALIIVRRITDPVSEMTRVAEAISLGNYAARIRRLPDNELGSLGQAINRLVEAVQANISRREKMEKIRREFSSNVSHELKTPLTSIKGYVDTLIEGAIHDEKNNVRFLRIINSNVDRMITLVKDLMNLATIEANEGITELGPVDWRPIIQEAVNRHQLKMEEKGIRFHTVFESQNTMVKGDRKAMSHILDNLLQNAVSYTPGEGDVELRLSNTPGSCVLSVRDTGIGIPKPDQARIFERFYRVDEARTKNAGGTGLGLAIVKHLVIQIQGTIAVESELNHGSTFTVRLPLAT